MSVHIKQSLERLVFGFESTKVTERRKVIEEFLELTSNSSNEVIKVLNELSKSKDSSLTWNKIYRIVHNAVLQEAEKQKKGTGAGSFRSSAVNKSLSSCCSLILKIARLAHEDKDNIFLSIKKTLFSVLQVLDTDLYRSHLSDTYLEILEKHVLSNRKHFNKIETKHWSDLMQIFERSLFSKEFNTNSGELLKPFFSIVQSCPVVVLYGLEETIEKLWNDYERTNTRFFNTYILKVTIEFCGRVACDRRQIICKLGENVIRIAKNMYSNKSEDFGGIKSLLFDFFLIQMLCHHPKGCPKGSPSSFAHSWKQWDTYVHNLFYELIDTEIKCILKSSKMGYFPGESEMKMWDNFVKFATEVLRQVLLKEFENENKPNTDIHDLDDKSPSRKKFCSEKRYTLLLNNLQSGSAWPWLQILSSLFKNYPETIPQSQYLITLDTLTKLSSSFNDVKKRCYLISCLTNVLNMQTTITNMEIITAASVSWNMIWEMIRTMWLHQNETDCYELIRMLVLHEKSLEIKSFFHNYMSRAMKITLPTIQTFAVMCRRRDLFETVDDRHASIQWIVKKSLDAEDVDLVLHSPIIAKLSTALIFKVVPDFERDPSNESIIKDRLSQIEEVYFKSSFEKVLLYENYSEKQIQTFNSNKDKEIQDFLIELLQERSHNMKHSTDLIDESKKIIDELHLICNVFSELCSFNLLEENAKDFQIMKSILDRLIKGLSVIWADVIKILETSNKNHTILDNLSSLFNLKLNVKVSSILRDAMSVEILPMLLKLYREKEDNSMNTEVYAGCSKSPLSNQKSIQITTAHLTKLLCSYAFSPIVICINACQKKTFLYIRLKYNQSIGCSITEEILIAKSIVRCRPGAFSCEELILVKDILDFLLEHHRYELITDILQILHDYISHVSVYKNEDLCRSVMVNLRTLYYDKNLFAQKVRIELIKCLHQLFVCDPEELWSKWDESSRPAWLILPSFLCDNFQEIRLFVIPILSVILVSTKCSRLSQKIFFDEICDKIIESFEIKKPFLCRDETDNRIVSALHGFMSIACSGSTYSRRSIFSIFQLHYQQKFQLDTTRNLIETLSVHLGNENVNSFINTNIAYLLGYWHQEKYPLSEFPYQLTNSTSEIDFYVKYVNITVPILLQNNDTKVLNNISCIINKPVDELIQTNFSSLYSIILPVFASEDKFPPAEVLKAKTIFSNLNDILSVSGVNSLILSTIDKILIDLLQMMFDTRNFIKEFSLNVTISEPGPKIFSFDIIMKTLEYIEKTILKSESIIISLVQKSPSKLEHVLRYFTLEIEKRIIIEEKLTAIHIFFTLVNTITKSFRSPVMNSMVPYLIRDICITFVHLIKKYRNNSNSQIISMVCCIALKKFCQQCILGYAPVVEEFLVVIVGALIPSSKDDSELGKVALNFLKYLIIEEHDNLSKAISQLDPFPSDKRFTEIRMLYNKSRRKFGTLDLENEIIHFLNIRQFSECPVESLEYLKEKLCTNKGELEKMYYKLESLQGTCEECDASSLHGLVYTLVKLCSSSDKNVSIEAAKCLGELGPADLMTLILRAKKVTLAEVMKRVNTQIVVAGYVIYLLSNLLIDADFATRSTASIAMYQVANSGPGTHFLSLKMNYVTTDFGKGSVERKYIVPFIKTASTESKIKKFIFRNKTFYEYLKKDTLWWNGDVSRDGHVHWITTLTAALLQLFPSDSFLNSLISLSKSKANFAEKLIPILIELILHEANTEVCMIISCGIKLFFTNVWLDVPVNLSSLDCMLDIVYFNKVRSNRNYIPDCKQSLELNYLFIAKAALIGSRYFACILYVELWCREQIEHYELEDDRLSILEKIYHVNPEDGKKIQNILREACEKVGDIDALQGCGVSYLLDMESRIDYYKRLGRWDQIICHYDLRLFNKNHINSSNESASNESLRPGASSLVDFKSNENIFYSSPKVNIAALKSAGLYNLAWNYSIGSENVIDSECCWRLSKWSYSNTESNEKIDFEKYRYFALKSVHEVNAENTLSYLERARSCVVETLTCSNSESCKKFYDSLSRLWSLREVEDFCDFFVSKKKTLDDVLTRWKENDRFNVNDFVYIEPVWSQRISMLKMANKNSSSDIVKQSLFDIQLKLAGMARKKGLTSVAKIFLSSILDMENLSATNKYKLKLEDAHLEWATSTDHMIGRHLLRNLLENRSETNMSLRSYALQLYGSWMLEKRWENAQPYFNESLEILNSLEELSDEDRHTRIDVYIQCAKLADTEYQKLADYMKSQELQCKKAFMKKSLEVSKALRSKYEKTKNITVDDRKLLCTSEHSYEIEKSEIEKTEKELNDYLNNAMKYYLLAVSESSEHNLKLFRLVSLWLQNRNCEISEFYDLISKVPTYKFLILLPQIIPHLTNKNDKFSKTIKEIIRKCAVDHPHHTLPVLISLANTYKDRDYASSQIDIPNDNRVATAQSLLLDLKKTYLKNLIIEMENVSNALISLAYLPSAKKSGKYSIPSSQPICRLINLEHAPIPTINIEISPSGNYSNIIGIHRWEKTYNNVGGVNAPKKIICIGSDGVSRSQLVKGQDDLRQDAVMQQVFTNLNTMLFASNNRHLKIRTYKIIPLSQRSGILEWCENTMNVADYLTGNQERPGAHESYRPKDLRPAVCREMMTGVRRKTVKEKLAVYNTICSKIKPVFHHFFWEHFGNAAIWWQRRRTYTLSVAASSAVGYILGLGDRHLSNLLIDKVTAEVVHIDFGIAFEQGKLLPTPETVPFRLTRDIEDAMGASGVEGTFRRSFERTMSVLRKNSDTILSILEVLLYDPLYMWTVSAAKAQEIQCDHTLSSDMITDDVPDEHEINFTAKSVLKRLALKLQGREDNTDASIEGQVERLLQRARDPANLSCLFSGWQPYL